MYFLKQNDVKTFLYESDIIKVIAEDKCSMEFNSEAYVICGNNCSIRTNAQLIIKCGNNCTIVSVHNRKIHVKIIDNCIYLVDDAGLHYADGFKLIDAAIKLKNLSNESEQK